ncbi:MAG: MSHA biogenesis protein MshI [Betaproteobacteria bacterium]
MSQQINLYNPLFLKQEKLFSARTMAQALGLVALGLAGIYAYSAMQTRQAERLSKDYASQIAAQREQMVALGARFAGNARSKSLEAEVSRLEAAVRSRQGLLDTLTTGQLGNSEGIARYFAAFGRQATPGVWLTGFAIGEGGNDLRVNGRVLHPDLVPVYFRALNREEVMRGRQVTELKLTAKEAGPATTPSASPATAGSKPAPRPEASRFVDFSIMAPLRVPESEKGPSKAGKS